MSMFEVWNKKGMGVSTSAHPRLQALALPLCKDKQRSQPTPSDYIFEYNQPTQTSRCIIF